MFDSHLHLTDTAFDADRAEVIARARDAGVAGFLTLGTDLASSRAALELAAREPGVFAAVGIHPCEVAHATPADFDAVARLAQEHRGRGKVVAIGETGIDYYWDATTEPAQKAALRWHLALARDLDLPVVLHNRAATPGAPSLARVASPPSSHRDLMAILEQSAAASGGAVRGVLHCFSGEAWYRETGVRLGLHFGFGGPLTYKTSSGVDDLRAVRAERALLETDAPYLPPVPHRGKRNEPAHIRLVLARAAEALGCDAAALDARTTANARALFGIGAG
jgi:TatD DNase family protein